MTVRLARLDDAAALAEVAAITFPLACPPDTTDQAKADFIRTALSVASFDGYLRDSTHAILVDEDARGALTGYIMLVFGEPADADVAAVVVIRPIAELSKCYVLPGAHGTGVAGDLLRAAFDVAAERGSAGIWLGVNDQNERAQRFYLKHGFAIVGRKGFHLGDRIEDDFVLERALPSASIDG